jgi:hypothetical protein
MRKTLVLAAVAGLLLPVMAAAQSPFDGTWKWDPSTAEWSKKPQVLLLENGTYQCKSCVPPIEVKADGQDQKVSGHPYYDTLAVKVVNDHQMQETQKKDGKVVREETSTVSPDGNTMAFSFTDISYANGEKSTGKGELARVAKGPAGSNAISGSWRMKSLSDMSSNGITWTYKVNGDDLTMTTVTGQSFTAKMDGSEAPMKGDPGVTTVSVKKVGKSTLEETDKRDGKIVGVMKSTVNPDGKTMKIVYEDKLSGRTTPSTATKQP